MIEPREGEFDFSNVDQVIFDARHHGLHLVLLWFGTYKNGTSCYVQGWVNMDPARFPQVQIYKDCKDDGDNRPLKCVDVINPFSQAACGADARAFSALMKHIKQTDAAHSTVLMPQIENECGIFVVTPGIEGMHPEFEKRWPQLGKVDVEAKLSWSEVFGQGAAAEEIFMAYALGTYVGKVAEAGKQEYPIPIFTNVWLNSGDASVLDVGGIPSESLPIVAGGGSTPGVYPSGGPCPHTIDLWKCCAPALDFISPAIYLQDYEWVCKQYRYQNQPLFIPEQRADDRGARRAWLAYGSYSALGCSPFGVDDIVASGNAFTKSYGILAKMSKHILAAQAANPEDVFGFFFDDDNRSPTAAKDACWTKTFAEFTVCVKRAFVFGKPGPGYGIVIHRGQGRFLLIGEGFEVSFGSIHSAAMYTGILEFTELNVDEHGALLPNGRKLNGDERRGGEVAIMPAENPDYGGFPIRVTIPARTYVAECIVYTI